MQAGSAGVIKPSADIPLTSVRMNLEAAGKPEHTLMILSGKRLEWGAEIHSEREREIRDRAAQRKKIALSTPLGSSRAGYRSYQRIYLPFPSLAHLRPRLSSYLFTRNLLPT